MAGKKMDPFVIALAQAMNEIEEQYGLADPEYQHALLDAFVLVLPSTGSTETYGGT